MMNLESIAHLFTHITVDKAERPHDFLGDIVKLINQNGDFDSYYKANFLPGEEALFKEYVENVKTAIESDSHEAEEFRKNSVVLSDIAHGDDYAANEFLKMVADNKFEDKMAEYKLLHIAMFNWESAKDSAIYHDIIAAKIKNPHASPRDFVLYSLLPDVRRDTEKLQNLANMLIEKYSKILDKQTKDPLRNPNRLDGNFEQVKIALSKILYSALDSADDFKNPELAKEFSEQLTYINEKFDYNKVMQAEREGLNHFDQVEKNNVQKLSEAQTENDNLKKEIENLKKQMEALTAEKDKTIADRDSQIKGLRQTINDNKTKYEDEIVELKDKNRKLEQKNSINESTLNLQNDIIKDINNLVQNFKSGIGKGQELANNISRKLERN